VGFPPIVTLENNGIVYEGPASTNGKAVVTDPNYKPPVNNNTP
jgi:hypothetical protein